MNTTLTHFALLPGKLDMVLYGVGALVLLVVAILIINFGMIYIRALFSGAKVTFLRRVRPALAVVFASSTLIGLAAESVVIALCRLFGVPYVIYLHTDVHRRIPAARIPLRPVLASVFRSAAACLVVGRTFRDELTAQGRDRVFVLPNCVDAPAGPNGTGRPGGDPRVLFLSNIEESKGIMTLLRAVPLVLAGEPRVTFSVVGPWRGPSIRREVEGFIAANGLGRSVTLAGEVYGDRKSEVMAEHDHYKSGDTQRFYEEFLVSRNIDPKKTPPILKEQWR